MWTAYYLKKADPGLRIVVLEARFAGFGASGRNGGWLSGLVPGDRERTARRHGRDSVVAWQRALNEAVDEVIDVAAREVRIDDEQILLTRTEFDILEALSGRPGNVLSRRQLLEIVRDGPWVGNEHLVDVHIGHLRRKLGDDAASPRYIATVRGVGYRMGTGQ